MVQAFSAASRRKCASRALAALSMRPKPNIVLNGLSQDGVPGPIAGSSVVADKTLQAFTQLIYTLLGLVLLVVLTGGRDFLLPVLGITALFAVGIYVFLRLQNAGLFAFLVGAGRRLVRSDGFVTLLGGADSLDAQLRETYRRRRQLLQATILRLAFRLAMAGEVWLALALMGHPVTVTEAIVLESLGHGIRAAGFAIPAGLGVQEGGFVLFGGLSMFLRQPVNSDSSRQPDQRLRHDGRVLEMAAA